MKPTALFNQDLLGHLFELSWPDEERSGSNTFAAFSLRGFEDVVGESGQRLPEALKFLGTPLVEAEVAAFSEKIDAVGLRQMRLTEHMLTNLRDPDFFKEFLPGIEFRYSQKIFLQGLMDFLESYARTVFGGFTTGSGKTLMAAAFLALLFARFPEGVRKPRVLVVSPRTTLNEQHANELAKFLKAVLQPEDFGAFGDGTPVEIDTMQMFSRLRKGDVVAPYDLVIGDELHRGLGEAYVRAVREFCSQAMLAGLSATPYVGSSGGSFKVASRFFERSFGRVSLVESAEAGEIAPIRAVQLTLNAKAEKPVEEMARRPSDLELERAMNKPLRTQLAVAIAKRLPEERKAVAFCAGVDHARDTAEALSEAGFSADYIHGGMPKSQQKKIIHNFRTRKIRFLCNADILIEGFDDPDVTDVIMLRPTGALWLYEQMIGRGSRYKPGKITTIWDVMGQHSGAMTLAGLADHYNALSGNPKNGEVLFGKNKAEEMDSQPREVPPLGTRDFEAFSGSLVGDFSVIEVDRVALGGDLRRLDEGYFADPEAVLTDLTAFATAAGLELQDLMIFKGRVLQCNPVALEAVANISMDLRGVSFSSYLKRALYVLRQSHHLYHSDGVLKFLLELTGIPFPEGYSSLETLRSYFLGDTGGVRGKIEMDLLNYCRANGLARIQDIKPEDIATATLEVPEIGTVSLSDYLSSAFSGFNFGSAPKGDARRLDYFSRLLFREGLSFLSDPVTYMTNIANVRKDWQTSDLSGLSFEEAKDRRVLLPNGERWSVDTYCKKLIEVHLGQSEGFRHLNDYTLSQIFSAWRFLSVHPAAMAKTFREAFRLSFAGLVDKVLVESGYPEAFYKGLLSVLVQRFGAKSESGKIDPNLFLKGLQSSDLTRPITLPETLKLPMISGNLHSHASIALHSTITPPALRNLFRWFLLFERCPEGSDGASRAAISEELFLLDDETLRQECVRAFREKMRRRTKSQS